MYKIDVLFHNRRSYVDLKAHNIFLRCWFMTNNLKISQDLNDIYKILSYFHKGVTFDHLINIWYVRTGYICHFFLNSAHKPNPFLNDTLDENKEHGKEDHNTLSK